MAKTHRGVVAFISGGAYLLRDSDDVASVVRLSERAAKLMQSDDGTVSAPEKGYVQQVENQMLSRIQIMNVGCNCPDDDDEAAEGGNGDLEVEVVGGGSGLRGLLAAISRAGRDD
jgi:hypothetical protein